MKLKIALMLAVIVASPPPAIGEELQAQNQDKSTRASMGEIKDQARFHKLVDDASIAYAAIAKGPHGEVPASVLKKSHCIAVLPSVLTGALIVGGTRGEGLASCRNESNNWSQPATLTLNQGSIGLQAGAKSADLVLFFQDKTAVEALKRGEFTLGADVSAVAGAYDSSVDASNAGVVVYTRAEGAFAGASVTGSKMAMNQDDLAGYYGKKVDYRAVLDGREKPDSSGYTEKLTKLFP